MVTETSTTNVGATERLLGLSIFLIVASAIGLLAAFELTYEKIQVLLNPEHAASCDFTLLVQCGKNMSSPQGSVFGFPNSLLGLIGWPVVKNNFHVVLPRNQCLIPIPASRGFPRRGRQP